MKKRLLILILLSASFYSEGQITFQKTYGGTSYEEGHSVQQTTDGGYIVAGLTGSFGAGQIDVYLIKTDSIGDLIWTKTFGSAALEDSYSVEQTMDGGYIVLGYSNVFGGGGHIPFSSEIGISQCPCITPNR